jgi:hypothetical protein
VSKRTDAPYCSGPSKMWLKSKNPASEAVRREREEEWQQSKVQSVDQRMRLECDVGFRQLRTCRRTRPGQLCATSGPIRQVCLQILSTLLHPPITIDRAAALSRNCRLVGPVEMDTVYALRDRGGCHAPKHQATLIIRLI